MCDAYELVDDCSTTVRVTSAGFSGQAHRARHLPALLRGRRLTRKAKALERSLENRLEIVRVPVDLGDSDGHVGDLFEGEVATNLVGALCLLEQWCEVDRVSSYGDI
jgi:hypothetical protein